MGIETGISWTDSTFNPWWGCAHAGPGCDECYAEKLAHRFGVKWGIGEERRVFGEKHWNDPRRWNAAAIKSGKRHLVFCASMADVFDKDAPDGQRERLWALIRETPALTWQIVTKRIGNAPKMLPADWGNGYPNVWLLATIVTQLEADRDIPKLLAVPAAVHGISAEPLLEEIDVRTHLAAGLKWVIVGGESGSNARPFRQAWAASLDKQCADAGRAFFFKQHGGADRDKGGCLIDGIERKEWPVAA
jgi:protein gp37